MAFGTEKWRTISKRSSCGALNIVYAMAINTRGDILIAFSCQRRAMDAFLVSIINGAMAFGTSLGNYQPRLQQ
jgi:hypothetical protein